VKLQFKMPKKVGEVREKKVWIGKRAWGIQSGERAVEGEKALKKGERKPFPGKLHQGWWGTNVDLGRL